MKPIPNWAGFLVGGTAFAVAVYMTWGNPLMGVVIAIWHCAFKISYAIRSSLIKNNPHTAET